MGVVDKGLQFAGGKFKDAGLGAVVSAILILSSLFYAIKTTNTDLVTFLAGAGIGYLLKDKK